jgi:hypothetical protein
VIEGAQAAGRCILLAPRGDLLFRGARWDGSIEVVPVDAAAGRASLRVMHHQCVRRPLPPLQLLLPLPLCAHARVPMRAAASVSCARARRRTVQCMALSEDGDVLLAGSDDGTLSLWRVSAAAGGLDDRRAAAEDASASGALDVPDDDAPALGELASAAPVRGGGGGGGSGGSLFDAAAAAAGSSGSKLLRESRSTGGRLSDSIIRVFSTALGDGDDAALGGHPCVPGPLRVMYGHAAGVTCVALRKEAGVCASGGADGACIVHMLATGCALCRVCVPAPPPRGGLPGGSGGGGGAHAPTLSCALISRAGHVVGSFGAAVFVSTLWCVRCPPVLGAWLVAWWRVVSC